MSDQTVISYEGRERQLVYLPQYIQAGPQRVEGGVDLSTAVRVCSPPLKLRPYGGIEMNVLLLLLLLS